MFERLAEDFSNPEFCHSLGLSFYYGFYVFLAIGILALFLMFVSGGFGGTPIDNDSSH